MLSDSQSRVVTVIAGSIPLHSPSPIVGTPRIQDASSPRFEYPFPQDNNTSEDDLSLSDALYEAPLSPVSRPSSTHTYLSSPTRSDSSHASLAYSGPSYSTSSSGLPPRPKSTHGSTPSSSASFGYHSKFRSNPVQVPVPPGLKNRNNNRPHTSGSLPHDPRPATSFGERPSARR